MKKLYVEMFFLATFLFGSSTVYAADKLRFKSNLSGAQEITTPPGGVVTDTTGAIRIKFDNALTKGEFRLVLRSGTGITQAHLHCAPAGVNGPVVAFLFGPIAPPGVDVEGELMAGTLDNSDIIPPATPADIEACGVPLNNIASLVFATLAGKIYANVHSTAFPPGVVRGQLLPRIDDKK